MSAPPLSYPAQEVRRLDRDRFVTALFAPAERRDEMLALYAFNLEVAKLRETVSEATIGLMRLQWWRDAVERIAAGQPAPVHPVAEGLAPAIRTHGLKPEQFDRLLTGREKDLYREPPADMAELEDYADATSGVLSQMAAQILGGTDNATQASARHAGIAWALTGILRSVPYLARADYVMLPQSELDSHAVDLGQLLAGHRQAALQGVARAVSERARHHLAQARRHRVPRSSLAALLPATIAGRYLDRLAAVKFDLFDVVWSQPRPPTIQLTFNALRGRF